MIDDIEGIAIILVMICIGLIAYISGESRTEEEIGIAFSLLKIRNSYEYYYKINRRNRLCF